jgi:hypothetical protein
MSKQQIMVLINPPMSEIYGEMKAIFTANNFFISRGDTLHSSMALYIKENRPEYKEELYNNSRYCDCYMSDNVLMIKPLFEYEDEQDKNMFINTVAKCLKNISYKIIEESDEI